MRKRHDQEILLYKNKLEHCYAIEKRQSNEIAMYKKKELQLKKNELLSQPQKNGQTSHPALADNVREDHKRKNSNVFR